MLTLPCHAGDTANDEEAIKYGGKQFHHDWQELRNSLHGRNYEAAAHEPGKLIGGAPQLMRESNPQQ